MLKKPVLSLVALGLVLILMAGTAIAQTVDKPSQETLEKQQQESQAIYDKYDTATNDMQQSLLVKKAELNVAMNSSSPNKEVVQKLSKEIGELQGKLRSAKMDLRAELQQAGLSNEYFCDETRQRNHTAGDCWAGYSNHNRHGHSNMTGHRLGANYHRKHMMDSSWNENGPRNHSRNDYNGHGNQRNKFRHSSDGNHYRSNRY